MNKSLKKWLDTYEYQVNEQDGFYLVVNDLQTGDIYKKTMPQLLIEFIDIIGNKLNYEEDVNVSPFLEWQLDMDDMQHELQLMVLEYGDIKNHKQVYVEYDKDSMYTDKDMNECKDGIGNVITHENGEISISFGENSVINNVETHIRHNGIKVYSL